LVKKRKKKKTIIQAKNQESQPLCEEKKEKKAKQGGGGRGTVLRYQTTESPPRPKNQVLFRRRAFGAKYFLKCTLLITFAAMISDA
jgi:hypothetical protein